VRIVPNNFGTLQIVQDVRISATIPAYGIVQTWIELSATADDGANVYAIANAMIMPGT
jgi:hypothetical protein